MSVKLLHGQKSAECPLIQKIGGYCFCRANNLTSSKQVKDRRRSKYEDKKIIIDLADYPHLKNLGSKKKLKFHRPAAEEEEEEGSEEGDGEGNSQPKRQYVEYTFDFGIVPVETSTYEEFHIIDSHSKASKKIEILGKEEVKSKNGIENSIDSVFRTILPASRLKSDLFSLSFTDKQAEEKVTEEIDCGATGDPPNSFGSGPLQSIPPSSIGKLPSCLNKFRVVFEPELPSMNYSEVFLILVDDDVEIVLKCLGFSEGPSICFSENVLNFGGQYLDDQSNLKLAMHNHSDCPGQFQFDNDNDRSIFKICPLQGIIEPRTYQVVDVTFQAHQPQVFYKRVNCLIHHQQPQYVELLGMCIPRPFFLLNPVDFCLTSDETKFLPFPTESNAEFFETGKNWGIHISKDTIDFGFQDVPAKDNDAHILKVSNVLPHDVIIDWIPDPTGVFKISPITAIVESRQSVLFEASFNPTYPETFYNGQLEFYVHPKTRMWPAEINPPWVHFLKDYVYEEDDTPTEVIAEEASIDKLEVPEELSQNKSSEEVEESVPESFTKNEEKVRKSKSRPSAPGTPARAQRSLMKKKKKKGLGPTKSKTQEVSIVSQNETGEIGSKTPNEISVTNFTKDLEETVQKLNESIPKKQRASIFLERAESFPLTLSFRHTGCSEKRLFSLEPQVDMPALHSLMSITSMASMQAINSQTYIHEQPSEALITSASVNVEMAVKDFQEDFNSLFNEESKLEICGNEEVKELAIPLCLVIKMVGHSFKTHSPVPQFFVPKQVTLPPTWPNSRVFRSFILRNHTDMPIYFDGLIDEDDFVCQIKPTKGVIPGNFHQIILVSMAPRKLDAKEYIYNCNMLFNLKDNNTIILRGKTEYPSLDLVACYKSIFDESEIVFQETQPGCHSETSIELRNSSRFHYKFSFSPVSRKNSTIFNPLPQSGLIAPYETLRINWSFSPTHESSYYVRWGLLLNVLRTRNEKKTPTSSPTPASNYFKELSLVGIGRLAKLFARPRQLDFGLVEVFKEKDLQFTLTNSSNVTVFVKLRLMHEDMLQYFPSEQIKLDCTEFLLHGRQSKIINVIVKPDRTNFQLFYVEYLIQLTDNYQQQIKEPFLSTPSTIANSTPATTTNTNEFKKICNVSFIGNHPVFKVTDIIHYTRHPIWDSEYCWTMFSLDKLNEYLLPSNVTKKGNVPNVQSVSFQFPPGPINSDPAVFSILLENNDMKLKGFWEIQMLPPRQWSNFIDNNGNNSNSNSNSKRKSTVSNSKNEDNANNNTTLPHEKTKDEKNILKFIWSRKITGKNIKLSVQERRKSSTMKEKKLPGSVANDALVNLNQFKISPLRGSLEPRKRQMITFSYKYGSVGKHKLSVLFRVHPGIYIWIDLQGMTLGRNEPYVHLMHAREFKLHPVCLSDLDPPIQLFWMYNAGNVNCSFKVDPTSFEEVVESNYGHQVFECLTLRGSIAPKSWVPIKLRFSPIEIKEYELLFDIMINNERRRVKLIGFADTNPVINLRPVSTGGSLLSQRKYQLLDPMVPMTLSPAQIIFDKFIPTGQKANSLLFLTNLSESNKISFSWPEIIFDGNGSITFIPQNGIVKPGEQIAIMVSVNGGSCSLILSRMVRCFMLDETSLAEYDLLSKAWHTSKSSLMNTTTEIEAEYRLQKQLGEKPEKPSSFSRQCVIRACIGTVFGMIDSVSESEQKCLPFSDTILQPLKPFNSGGKDENGRQRKKLVLPPFIAQLSREIISSILWDMINSSSFPSYVKQISKGRAPLYYEYKESELKNDKEKKDKKKVKKLIPVPNYDDNVNPILKNTNVITDDDQGEEMIKSTTLVEKPKHFLRLPRKTNEDILENVLFNLIQEAASSFRPGKINNNNNNITIKDLKNI